MSWWWWGPVGLLIWLAVGSVVAFLFCMWVAYMKKRGKDWSEPR